MKYLLLSGDNISKDNDVFVSDSWGNNIRCSIYFVSFFFLFSEKGSSSLGFIARFWCVCLYSMLLIFVAIQRDWLSKRQFQLIVSLPEKKFDVKCNFHPAKIVLLLSSLLKAMPSGFFIGVTCKKYIFAKRRT